MGIESTGAPTDEQDDFDEHFAALSAERRGSSESAGDKGADSTATTQAAASTAAGQPGAQATGQQGDAAGKDAGGTTVDTNQAAGQGDIEQLRAELARVNTELGQALHRERSVAGRISSADSRSAQLVRENDDLKRQVADLQNQLKNRPAATQAATKDILSETPDLEAAIKARIDAATGELQQALDAANDRLNELGQAASKPAQQTASQPASGAMTSDELVILDELDKSFTKAWRKDVASPDFARWLPKQSRAIQDAYDQGATVQDTSMVLELFYASRGNRPRPEQQPGTTTTTPPNSGTPKPADPGQDRLRRAAGLAPRSSVPAKPGPAEDDFDGHFEVAARERAMANRGNTVRI